jgi:hypothetical protein
MLRLACGEPFEAVVKTNDLKTLVDAFNSGR